MITTPMAATAKLKRIRYGQVMAFTMRSSLRHARTRRQIDTGPPPKAGRRRTGGAHFGEGGARRSMRAAAPGWVDLGNLARLGLHHARVCLLLLRLVRLLPLLEPVELQLALPSGAPFGAAREAFVACVGARPTFAWRARRRVACARCVAVPT
eukprot:3185353-Prymnesium_polylepis.2